MSRRYNNNQSSGGPQSHTQTYRTIVVGGGGVGKSAITIQFIQVSWEHTFKCEKKQQQLKQIKISVNPFEAALHCAAGLANDPIETTILIRVDILDWWSHSFHKIENRTKYLKNYATIFTIIRIYVVQIATWIPNNRWMKLVSISS